MRWDGRAGRAGEAAGEADGDSVGSVAVLQVDGHRALRLPDEGGVGRALVGAAGWGMVAARVADR